MRIEMLNDNKQGKLYVCRRHVKLNNHGDARRNSQRNLRAENKEKENNESMSQHLRLLGVKH